VALRPTVSGGLPLSTHRYSVVCIHRVGRRGLILNVKIALICSTSDKRTDEDIGTQTSSRCPHRSPPRPRRPDGQQAHHLGSWPHASSDMQTPPSRLGLATAAPCAAPRYGGPGSPPRPAGSRSGMRWQDWALRKIYSAKHAQTEEPCAMANTSARLPGPAALRKRGIMEGRRVHLHRRPAHRGSSPTRGPALPAITPIVRDRGRGVRPCALAPVCHRRRPGPGGRRPPVHQGRCLNRVSG
jgi:hypothetical protein